MILKQVYQITEFVMGFQMVLHGLRLVQYNQIVKWSF